MTQTHAMELRLKSPEQLFNTLDPTPFDERDLDDKAERFIVGWAQDADRDADLRLMILLPPDHMDSAAARSMPDAVHNYFAYRAEQTRHELREMLRIGWRALAIGIVVLLACLGAIRFLDLFAAASTVRQLAQESLLILGWVANWRPIEIFLYDWWPIVRRHRLLKRLASMPVEVRPIA